MQANIPAVYNSSLNTTERMKYASLTSSGITDALSLTYSKMEYFPKTQRQLTQNVVDNAKTLIKNIDEYSVLIQNNQLHLEDAVRNQERVKLNIVALTEAISKLKIYSRPKKRGAHETSNTEKG